MTRERGRFEFKPVEQLAVVDGEIEPAYEGMHSIGVTASGARKSRGIDRVAGAQSLDERDISIPGLKELEKDRATRRENDGVRDLLPDPEEAKKEEAPFKKEQ